MARVLITGSSDGLGLAAAQLLANEHHEVVAHARNKRRAADTRKALPGAAAIVVGDLSSIAGMRQLAEAANTTGPFDAVIHNAAVGSEPRPITTPDGLNNVFAVNVVAPYLLTALIDMPDRLVYLSSGSHRGGSTPSTTCNGRTAVGAARRPTQTASFSLRYSRRRSPVTGLACSRTRSTRVGSHQDGWSRCTRFWSWDLRPRAGSLQTKDPAALCSGAMFFHKSKVAAAPRHV